MPDAARDPVIPAETVPMISIVARMRAPVRARLAGVEARVVDHGRFAECTNCDAEPARPFRILARPILRVAGFMRLFTSGIVAVWPGGTLRRTRAYRRQLRTFALSGVRLTPT